MQTFTHHEFGRVHQLLGECREMGDEVTLWLNHFAKGILDLLNDDTIGIDQVLNIRGHAPVVLGVLDTGWDAGFNRQGWQNAMAAYTRDPYYHPVINRAYERLQNHDIASVCRGMVLSDIEWYRHDAYEAISRVMGCDDLLEAFCRIRTRGDDFHGMAIFRERGKPGFTESDAALLEMLLGEAAPLFGGVLADFHDKSLAQLTPRVRQVLACSKESATSESPNDWQSAVTRSINISRRSLNTSKSILAPNCSPAGFAAGGGTNSPGGKWMATLATATTKVTGKLRPTGKPLLPPEAKERPTHDRNEWHFAAAKYLDVAYMRLHQGTFFDLFCKPLF